MFNKKAQAAMEFLMTYGWAMLVVMVVIGALAYFGVLSPTALLPEKCFLPLGINCKDHLVSVTEGAKFNLQNGIGNKITIKSFIITSVDDPTVYCDSGDISAAAIIQNGQSYTVDIGVTECYNLVSFADEKHKFDIEMKYFETVGFTHTMRGDLLTTIEP